MQAVFNHFKIKVPWNDVRIASENWSNVYKHERLRSMGLEGIQLFHDIFYWGDDYITLDRCRNKLIDWLSKHKEFYNDDANIVHERMIRARNEANVRYGTTFPFINWIPEYGGMLRQIQQFPENKWHKKDKVPFFLAKQSRR